MPHAIRSRSPAAIDAGPLDRSRRAAISIVRDTLVDDVPGLAAELAYRWSS